MATKCGFCENKLKANEGYNVKEVVIDKSPGIIKLTDVLLDLYLCEVCHFQMFTAVYKNYKIFKFCPLIFFLI